MNKYKKYVRERKVNRILLVTLLLVMLMLAGIETFRIFFSDAYYNDVLGFVEVPVLKLDLGQREVIRSADIEIISLPGSFISEDIILDPDLLEGRYIKLGHNINAGSPVSGKQLETGDNMAAYGSALLNRGQSLYAVNTDLLKSSGNLLTPSMKVDVYLTVETDDDYISDLLIENARIAAVRDSSGNDISCDNADKVPYMVILALDEEYIPLMNVALRVGDFDLFISDDCYASEGEASLNDESKVLKFIQ